VSLAINWGKGRIEPGCGHKRRRISRPRKRLALIAELAAKVGSVSEDGVNHSVTLFVLAWLFWFVLSGWQKGPVLQVLKGSMSFCLTGDVTATDLKETAGSRQGRR